jgi:hypothetical protein
MALIGVPERATPAGIFMDTSVIGPSPEAITQYVYNTVSPDTAVIGCM